MKLSKWTPYFVIILISLQFVASSNGNQVNHEGVITPNQEPDYELPYVNETNVVIDGQIGETEYVVSFQDERTDIFVYWEHNTTVLSVGLIAPGTGYVGFGIGPGMDGSNMIIGGVITGSVYAYDMDSTGKTAPSNDTDIGGTYDIISYDATETATETIFEFQIYLNTGDVNDNVITVGQNIDMYLGFHETNDGNVYHTARSRVWDVYVSDTIYSNVVYPPFDTSIPLILDSNVVIDGEIAVAEYTENFYDQSTGVTVYWEHNEVNLTIALESPGTGWVSIGFGTQMFQSSMIMGGYDSDGAYCNDLTGIPDWEHNLDTEQGGTDDILSCGASEHEGGTTFEFVIPMDSGDTLDPVFAVDEVFPMFLGFQLTSDDRTTIHTGHSQILTALVRPVTVGVISEMVITAPVEVHHGDNFTLVITLTDNNSLPYVNRNVEFFLKTALGDYIIEVKKTDANGQANITYNDKHLIYDHYFGARFKQVVEPAGSDLTVYLGAEATTMIKFLDLPEEELPLIQRYSREGLILMFWVTGLIIWGSFSISLYGIIEIFRDRERGGKKGAVKANE